MLQKGIIVESISSWMAPAVYVSKKLSLCRDYRELNKPTFKYAYPLPLVDEFQDRFSGSAIFSKYDLQSCYWQVPVDIVNQGFQPKSRDGVVSVSWMPFGWFKWGPKLISMPNEHHHVKSLVSTYIHDF